MKHEIEIPDLPEGWKAVAYGKVVWGEWYLTERGIVRRCECTGMQYPALIVEKIQPRRIVLEETEEDNQIDGHSGIFYLQDFKDIKLWNQPKIWREVKESE